MVKSLPAFHWEEVMWIEWNACPFAPHSPGRNLAFEWFLGSFADYQIEIWVFLYSGEKTLRWDKSSFSSRFAGLLWKLLILKHMDSDTFLKLYLYAFIKGAYLMVHISIELDNHHHSLILEHFHHFKEKFHAHMQLLVSSTIPGSMQKVNIFSATSSKGFAPCCVGTKEICEF